MTKPTATFYWIAGLALAWNLVGLLAVIADLRLTPADIAALPPAQQALYAARPAWSVVASLAAVGGGSLGCLLLLLRRRWALPLLWLSVAGIVLQDVGIFVIAGAGRAGNGIAIVLQGLVLVIGLGLILYARRAAGRDWLT